MLKVYIGNFKMNNTIKTIYKEFIRSKARVFKDGIIVSLMFNPYSFFDETKYKEIDYIYKKYATKTYNKR